MNCDSKHKEKSGSVFERHDAGVAGLQTDRRRMQGSNDLLQVTDQRVHCMFESC